MQYIYTENSYELLARVDSHGEHADIFWYHTELNGLPDSVTDSNGDTVWRLASTAWGRSLRESTPVTWDTPQNLRFQGQYLDRETGLHYNTFRYYDPAGGCYTQMDPIGLAGGLNTYTYVVDPLVWVDPLGLVREPIIFLPEGGDVLHPGTVDPVNNPEGLFKIKATGSYFDDKDELYKAAGLNERKSNKWISHHVSYDPKTNEMLMQLVNAEYHAYPHVGGAHEFEKITGFKYGTPQAIEEAASRSLKLPRC
ncbi:RHS repeat-associated core domain-containing protein [Kosakonia cowanii]